MENIFCPGTKLFEGGAKERSTAQLGKVNSAFFYPQIQSTGVCGNRIEQTFRGYAAKSENDKMKTRFSLEGWYMAQQLETIWNDSLNLLKKQLNTPTFTRWFENTHPVSVDDTLVTIAAPNQFTKEWLESRYIQLIESAISEVIGEVLSVKFIVSEPHVQKNGNGSGDNGPQTAVSDKDDIDQLIDPNQAMSPHVSSVRDLNPKYSFDSFVIGASNRFAHAAALAVAEQPAKAYNPFFIYGGVGLGKTHLLHAIGHYVARHTPHLRVKYVSSEKFTNDFINSIRDKDKIAGFQRKYRNVDVLLVDDIQFLENKEATQEEFFHTFNTLHQANKQIVISSDRPPKEIATLEDRLRSRFEMGLITDVQPPDLETRIAILRKKAQAEKLSIPNDVMEFIASRIQSNIRELEGALIRVLAYSSLTGSPAELSLAKDVLSSIIPSADLRPVDISLIQKEASKYYGVSIEDLLSPKRSQAIVYPRQIAMYLSRELTDCSLPTIGRDFGNRDHTTVMHACGKIQKLIAERRETYNEVQTLTGLIKREV